ncbi:MAG: choice-of-anchor D domain-containing protein [Rhodothermales bacterium]|nr:choice-of-anchor D domain-containing protein [Rhodothermales bacterium]MBO6778665.1 choice-of-anchor D domain-containing protein [Rhodothermales bacterium]
MRVLILAICSFLLLWPHDAASQALRGELSPFVETASMFSAYDPTAEQISAAACVTAPTSLEGGETFFIDLSGRIRQSDIKKKFGLDLQGSYNWKVTKASATLNYLRETETSGFSIGVNYAADYTLGSERIAGDATLTANTPDPTGNPGGFAEKCGSSFISQIDYGAYLMFSVRIDFSSREDLEDFRASFSIEGPWGSASKNLSAYEKALSRDARISVSVTQIGGIASQAKELLGEGGGQGTTQCLTGNFGRCLGVVAALIDYSQTGFLTQLEDPNGPKPIRYHYAPYTDLGYSPGPWPMLEAAILGARESLSVQMEQQLNVQAVALRLLQYPLGARRSAVEEGLAASEANIVLIADATVTCYTRIPECLQAVADLELTPVDQGALEFPPRPTSSVRIYNTLEGLLSEAESARRLEAVDNQADGEVTADMHAALAPNGGSSTVALLIDGQALETAQFRFDRVSDPLRVLWNGAATNGGLKSQTTIPFDELPDFKRVGEARLLFLTDDTKLEDDDGLYAGRDINIPVSRSEIIRGRDGRTRPDDGSGLFTSSGYFYVLVFDGYGREYRFNLAYSEWILEPRRVAPEGNRRNGTEASSDFWEVTVDSRTIWHNTNSAPPKGRLLTRRVVGDTGQPKTFPRNREQYDYWGAAGYDSPYYWWYADGIETVANPGRGALVNIWHPYSDGVGGVKERNVIYRFDKDIAVSTNSPLYRYANTGSGANSEASVFMYDWAARFEADARLASPTRDSTNFGSTEIGETAVREVVLMNEGNVALEVTPAISGDQYGAFSVARGGSTFAIEPGLTDTLQVLFTPSTFGSQAAVLSVQHTADNQSNPLEFLLSGVAVGCPWTASPTNLVATIRGQAQVDGEPATSDDCIAALDEDGNVAGAGDLAIDGGVAYINLRIYGDDETTTDVDEGMSGSEDFTLRLFDSSGSQILVYPHALGGWRNTNGQPLPDYSDLSKIYNFTQSGVQSLTLEEGWSLVSPVVQPSEASGALEEVAQRAPDVTFVSGFRCPSDSSPGGIITFDPTGPPFLQDLNALEAGRGYWFRSGAAATLELEGLGLPSDFSLSLCEGWNLVGYWGTGSLPVREAFATLIADDILEFVTGFQGGVKTFNPADPDFINDLDTLETGLGYWVKVRDDVSGFRYDESSGSSAVAGRHLTQNTQTQPKQLRPNPVFMTVGGRVTSDGSELPREILVHDPRGVLVGVLSVSSDGRLRTTAVYGDDPGTQDVDGALAGELLSFSAEGWQITSSHRFGSSLDPTSLDLGATRTLQAELPSEVELAKNYPNPFNPSTTLRFALPEAGRAKLTVFNLIGQQVARLVDQELTPGWHEVQFNAAELASGVYLYRLEAGGTSLLGSMLLQK